MQRVRALSIVAVLAATFVAHSALAQGSYALKVLAAPGAVQTFAAGISSAGVIAGTYYSSGETHSFTYDTRETSPTFVPFTVPPAHGGTVLNTVIAAISLHGDIAGNYTEKVGMKSTTYGFLYSGATYTTFEFPGSVQTEVTAVSS